MRSAFLSRRRCFGLRSVAAAVDHSEDSDQHRQNHERCVRVVVVAVVVSRRWALACHGPRAYKNRLESIVLSLNG